MTAKDTIIIQGLEVTLHIGVPDSEREKPQMLRVNLMLVPHNDFVNLDDNITKTVDYYEVAQRVKQLGRERPRKLIETFAEEISQMILSAFAISEVTVEIEKFILPDTDFVGVRLTRQQS